MTLGPSTVRAPQEVSHPPEPVSSDQSGSESEGYQPDVLHYQPLQLFMTSATATVVVIIC